MLIRIVLFVACVLIAVGLLQRLDLVGRETPDGLAVAVSEDEPSTPLPATGPVVIRADSNGHYHANAIVAGHSVRFLIDTGATVVALSAETARHLNMSPKKSEYVAMIQTANGTIGGAPVTLAEVKVGSASVRSVPAIVMPEGALDENLLGMSFLSRLRGFESSGRQLTLKP